MATYATAEPKYVEANGIRFAYLRFGSTSKSNVPLVFMQHFRGTFDHWDPELVDPIAAVREVILVDNSGVGKSGGAIATTYAGWADNVMHIVKALGITQIDLFGFSMGGFAAQMATLNHPGVVRRLILGGTGPSAGEGLEAGDGDAFKRLATASNDGDQHDGFLSAFYSLTTKKQDLGNKWWSRMTAARSNRSDYVGAEGTGAQIAAVMRWNDREYASEGSYDRLHEIKIPVLVANGDNDILVPTVNSWVMFRRLVNSDAHLHIYPDTGHGYLNEYAAHFSGLVNQFLDA